MSDPVTPAVIDDGAQAICPAGHRSRRRSSDGAQDPPCAACYAVAESAVRAALPRLLTNLGTTQPDEEPR